VSPSTPEGGKESLAILVDSLTKEMIVVSFNQSPPRLFPLNKGSCA
jgi:hypothetical protein